MSLTSSNHLEIILSSVNKVGEAGDPVMRGGEAQEGQLWVNLQPLL